MAKISIVVPFYNESESVVPLYERLRDVMGRAGGPYELVFIDDGSVDNTPDKLREIASKDGNVSVIRLEPNQGQTAALKAGFGRASGDVIISMDGDLQNDPKDIPGLLRKLDEDYDFVCGWRRRRIDPLSKKIASWFGNIGQRAFFKSDLHDISCTLRAYKKDAVRALPLRRKGAHRFIPYLLMMKGKRPAEVEVGHSARRFGRSKYGFSRSFIVFRDFLSLMFKRDFWL